MTYAEQTYAEQIEAVVALAAHVPEKETEATWLSTCLRLLHDIERSRMGSTLHGGAVLRVTGQMIAHLQMRNGTYRP